MINAPKGFALLGWLLITSTSNAAEVVAEPACLKDEGPRAAVLGYVTAMKEQRFEEAYNFVTETMTDGKSAADWAAPQRMLFKLGGVQIGEIDVRVAKRELSDPTTCTSTAMVPNVLIAGDLLNNQGSTEFEVYTVMQGVDGKWRIDSQQTLFDEPSIHQWFPGETIPEFKDTADTP
ncbi:MAG: hypothetical protein EXR86_03465 [Gammaproteobacteria bacterium]|nr:hypothetical protein [Gammaproteobacteria bacterium]